MEDERYIRRCIQLAGNGRNNVSPNPMVGAVIVCDGKIIGEGYHITYGGPHAEVNAIRSVKDESLLKRSTLYVSLEPCSHHGKTPPCTDLIIEKQIPRIVVGCRDPFIQVAGRGVRKLRDAGREVTAGVLEEECRRLIRCFTVANTLHRPYIVLKWAESADGFMDVDRTGGTATRLSTDHTIMLVHKKRAEADAIMVGTHTAALDNPSLNVRHWYGKNPLRIVPDRYLTLNRRLHLFDGSIPTLVYTTKTHRPGGTVEYITLDDTKPLLPQIMDDLGRRRIQTLLVEGGSRLLQSFIDDGLWDEIFVEKSRTVLLSGVKAPEISPKHTYSLQKNFGVYTLHYAGRNTEPCSMDK
jgi:diaminohydroxyphosphoribosylaminopyrimidine deaminase/5-amino-6-(5-phosphoribosylamino)uracil reductase